MKRPRMSGENGWHTPGSGGWGAGRGFFGRFRARTIANGVFVWFETTLFTIDLAARDVLR